MPIYLEKEPSTIRGFALLQKYNGVENKHMFSVPFYHFRMLSGFSKQYI